MAFCSRHNRTLMQAEQLFQKSIRVDSLNPVGCKCRWRKVSQVDRDDCLRPGADCGSENRSVMRVRQR